MKQFVFIFLVVSAISNLVCAQDCKVLLKSINQSYSGDCRKGKADGVGVAKGIDIYEGEFKKGFPNGKGVYVWSNGNTYKGNFIKGKKEGQGELFIKREQKQDSIVKGFWKKDNYIGAYASPFKKLDKSSNVSSIALNKVQDDIKNLRFYLRADQKYIKTPAFNVVVHYGQYQTQIDNKDFVELTNVTFPIKLKAYFKQDFIEIEIFQPGLWEIRTDLTLIKGLNTRL